MRLEETRVQAVRLSLEKVIIVVEITCHKAGKADAVPIAEGSSPVRVRVST
jgi:hypothetical protein